ncbi:hypothetical protein [Halosimplex marinum]
MVTDSAGGRSLEVCPDCESPLVEDVKHGYYCENCGWRHVRRTA